MVGPASRAGVCPGISGEDVWVGEMKGVHKHAPHAGDRKMAREHEHLVIVKEVSRLDQPVAQVAKDGYGLVDDFA